MSMIFGYWLPAKRKRVIYIIFMTLVELCKCGYRTKLGVSHHSWVEQKLKQEIDRTK